MSTARPTSAVARLLVPLAAAALVVTGCATVDGTATPAASVTDRGSSTEDTESAPTGGGSDGGDPAPSQSPTTGLSPAPVETPTSEPSTSEPPTSEPSTPSTSEPAQPQPVAFGGTYTYRNGMQVTVSKPADWKAPPKGSQDAKFLEIPDTPLKLEFTITIKNGSTQPWLGGYGIANGLTESGGRLAKSINDVRDAYTTPRYPLMPGQSASFKRAWGVQGRNNLSMSMNLYYNDALENITFTSDGGAASGKQTDTEVPRQQAAVVKFGQTFRYASGLTVKIDKPAAFTPAETAMGAPAKKYLLAKVQITNGSKQTYDFRQNTVLTAGGRPAGEIRDRTAKIGDNPDGSLPPGSTATLKLGFGATTDRQLALQFSPSTQGFVVIFTDLTVGSYTTSEPAQGVNAAGGQGSSTGTTAGTEPPTTSQAPSTTLTDTEIRSKGPVEAAFGGTVSWENGISISIGKPVAVTTDSASTHLKGTTAAKAEITVTNKGKEPLTGYAPVTAYSKDMPVESLVDVSSDIGIAELSVQPGASQRVTVGFWVYDVSDMKIAIAPASKYDTMFFSSNGPVKPKPVKGDNTTEDEVKLPFGKTYTHLSGVSMTVRTKPTAPVGTTVGDTGTDYITVELTQTNNSTTVQKSGGVRVRSDGKTADSFRSPGTGVPRDTGSVELAPGWTITTVSGFKVAKGKPVTVTVRPPYNEDLRAPDVTWS